MSRHESDIFGAIATESFDRLQRMLPLVPDINIRDARMKTPLIAAMGMGDRTVLLNTVRLLIRNGSDINAQDELGRSALMLACTDKEKLDVVELLGKNQNCNLNLKDREGNTALHHAVDSGNAMAVRLLLSSSSDKRKVKVNEPNNAGLSAYKLAGRLQHVRCSRMLVKHGGPDLITNDDGGADKNSTDSQIDGPSLRKRPGSRVPERKEPIQSMIDQQRTKTPFELTARSVKTPKYNQSVKIPADVPFRREKTRQGVHQITEFPVPQQATEKPGLPKLRPKSEILPMSAFVNPYRSFHRPLSDRRVVTLSSDAQPYGSRPQVKDGTYFEPKTINSNINNSQGYSRPTSRYPGGMKTLEGKRPLRLDSISSSRESGNSLNVFPEEISPKRDPQNNLENAGHNNRARFNPRRVLTPIASAQAVYEDLRSISPAPERARERLPSIASGKTLYLLTPRETPSELF